MSLSWDLQKKLGIGGANEIAGLDRTIKDDTFRYSSSNQDYNVDYWQNVAKNEAKKYSSSAVDTYTENESYGQNYGVSSHTRNQSVWSEDWLGQAMERGYQVTDTQIEKKTRDVLEPVYEYTTGAFGEKTQTANQIGTQNKYNNNGEKITEDYYEAYDATDLSVIEEEIKRNDFQMQWDEQVRQAVEDERLSRQEGTGSTGLGLGVTNIGNSVTNIGSSIENMGDGTGEGVGGSGGVSLLG